MNTKIITVPGAEIKLIGNTVRDLIAALEQVDPDTKTTVQRIKVGCHDHAFGRSGPARILNIIFTER